MSNQSFEEKVSIPYAEALIASAQKSDSLVMYKNDLSSISKVLCNSNDLEKFLLNHLNNSLTKKEVLKKLFKDQINASVMNFLLVLVDRRRISFLKAIIERYLSITYSLESVTIAELYSAIDINESQQNDLISKIKLITKSNEIKLIIKIDPELIGGFIIKIGSKVIDASIAGKLNKISLYLNVL